ncbi:putative glutamate dehydrogenase, NAD(+)-specific [Jaminaea rosea]|uniref:NAD-specific glutamate dehydrogenase n=1 Tax=Jaminaea rosea TaxID=1569628 RepID=A0A316V2H0_9BASI|nr:putative glutamate dehydrogenase, NAD(+)-specific [Jaminaea rosea]PWN30761.1 putative glutamate dehydrogenase, NAD(+)-specific [Jaminaea rosea]
MAPTAASSTPSSDAKTSSSSSSSSSAAAGSAALSSMASLKNSLLSVPGSKSGSGTQTPTVPNANGYAETTFPGKAEQAQKAIASVKESGFIPPELVEAEVMWFYQNLGIDDQYFAAESLSTICDHITALYGAKVLAYTKHSNTLEIDLEHETSEGAVFIHSSSPGASVADGGAKPQYETRIDEKYLDKSNTSDAWRLETYRSKGSVSSSSPQRLRCYFLSKCKFVQPVPKAGTPEFRDIRCVSDPDFLSKASSNTLEIYQEVIEEALDRTGPVIELFQVEGSREHRVVIGYRQETTHGFFSALSSLYHFYHLFSSRKYVEQFSNGVTIVSLYLNPLPGSKAPPIEHSIHQVIKEASLVFCLPDNPFFQAGESASTHAVQEATYAYVGWLFAQHFCNRLGQSYQALRRYLDESNPEQAAVLNDIKLRFREETFTRQSIQDVLQTYPDIVRLLYVHFANIHYPGGTEDDELVPTLSYQRLVKEEVLTDDQMYARIRKATVNQHEFQVLEALLLFNKAVLKTNFYTPTKVALSFRLDPGFLPEVEYPIKPFGIFFVVGSDFRGFHVRFRDVARGGIRIVRSRNRETYSINQRTLFDENYALASTQHLKNKDIPEGGSKGTILPSLDANPRMCFEKYCDSLLDVLLEGQSPGVKVKIVDLVGKEEILFLGPDEGTADCMDWAAEHARQRNAPWWKSFTTGKTAATLGGVPHDVWGMTSLSVRQYSTGIIRKLGLREEDVTKVQTGGPDGDLGSNEIFLSKDKTTTIIDGSGVIHDPVGLNREELTRLARARKMISDFDVSKLGPDGYRVLVEENDVKLPSGEVIPDGVQFRNTAHLRFKADLFVPCGGRPESINISNVTKLFDAEGKPHFKYIAEGANLFITKQARVELERRGVILYPDASANKGGVTSSSLEVLCGLSLTDEEYQDLMIFKDGQPSKFYLGYVRDIQNIISQNAQKEFEAIWHEATATGKPRSLISTELSQALNVLSEELEGTDLFHNVAIRNSVMSHVFPQTLQKKVGLEKLIERIPEAYARSAFAAFLAADFIYKNGPGASHVAFFLHLRNLAPSS